jgi:hypothetical protein
MHGHQNIKIRTSSINNYKTVPAVLRKPEKLESRVGSHGNTSAGSLYDISGSITKSNLVTLSTRIPDPTVQIEQCRSLHTKHMTQNMKYHNPFRDRRTMGPHAATYVAVALNWSWISDLYSGSSRFEFRPTDQLPYFVLTWFILILCTRWRRVASLTPRPPYRWGKVSCSH